MDVALGFIPGVAHAGATIMVGYPFDTVKTRLQTGMYMGLRQCLADSLGREGLASFYRGASVPLASLLFKRPIEFYIFEELQTANPMGASDSRKGFVNGSVAGMTGAVFGCPFNVVKVRVQDYRAQQLVRFPGGTAAQGTEPVQIANRDVIRAVLRDVFLIEHSYFRGLSVALLYTIPAASLYLGTYGKLREVFLDEDRPADAFGSGYPKWVKSGVAGATASSCMLSVMLPLDTVRTVIQAQVGVGSTTSIVATVRRILAQRGAAGLWAGLTPVVMRSLPSSFASMGVYETTRSWVNTFKAQRREAASQ